MCKWSWYRVLYIICTQSKGEPRTRLLRSVLLVVLEDEIITSTVDIILPFLFLVFSWEVANCP